MKNNRVYAKVDLDAVLWNIKEMSKRLRDVTKIMAVIKADGYGHGSGPIAGALEDLDILWGYAVATAEEAFELREQGIKKPILILGYTFEDTYQEIIRRDIMPTIFDLHTAEKYSKLAVSLKKTVSCHIKIDTGMSRIGFQVTPDEADTIKKISELPGLHMAGIFTHFARSDEEDKSYTDHQFDLFNKMIGLCEERGVSFDLKHCANSAAILEYPKASLDLVRAGIILYGLWPSPEVRHDIDLKPALSLYSHVVHVKTLEAGRSISYGGTNTLAKTTRVATIPVGYADGYCRGLSNKGYVLIHGEKAPILGRVCMDQFMVDVTDIHDVAVTDEVILIGRDGEHEITLEELGDLSGRFNYEFVCDLGMRIPREYYRDGKLIEVKGYTSVEQTT
ncbi:MAG: alanine racemase [Lachnospiraceae bacterium]|nr:alanine racemase [Lachnospiraceae bacterium]